MSLIAEARKKFHAELISELFVIDEKGKPSNSDKSSMEIALRIAAALGAKSQKPLKPQTSGNEFERIVRSFLDRTFLKIANKCTGTWSLEHVKSRSENFISQFEQYNHLGVIRELVEQNAELEVLVGDDYLIASDVVIARHPESDEMINQSESIVDSRVARHSALRAASGAKPSLHASISCKWTLRSDRAQNARAEALNLIRTRKGRAPHIVVVTGEPLPSRLASIALGTGDIDCVYHAALPELTAAVREAAAESQIKKLKNMISQKRLKDISDLPLDLML